MGLTLGDVLHTSYYERRTPFFDKNLYSVLHTVNLLSSANEVITNNLFKFQDLSIVEQQNLLNQFLETYYRDVCLRNEQLDEILELSVRKLQQVIFPKQ